MRLTLAFIFSIILAVGIVAFGFTFFQSSAEKNKLIRDLEIRAAQVAGEVFQGDSMNPGKANLNNFGSFADSISNRYNLIGMAVYYNRDSILTNNSASRLA